MYSTDFLTVYAADRMNAARHYTWAENLRPSHRARLAQQLQQLATRLQPDLASTTSTTSVSKRKAF